jgi:hypothetical protein
MSNPKTKSSEQRNIKVVVKTIEVQSKSEFDRQIAEFYETYAEVKVLGYSIDHLNKDCKRTYVMTLQAVKIS